MKILSLFNEANLIQGKNPAKYKKIAPDRRIHKIDKATEKTYILSTLFIKEVINKLRIIIRKDKVPTLKKIILKKEKT